MKFWVLWIQNWRVSYIHIELVVFLWKICPQKTQCEKNEVDMKWLWAGLHAPKGEMEKRGDSGFIHFSLESSSRENIMEYHMKGCEWDSLNSCYFPIIVHLVLVQYLSALVTKRSDLIGQILVQINKCHKFVQWKYTVGMNSCVKSRQALKIFH